MAASDDELVELLGAALAPPDREPPADRVAAVRAAARQMREQAQEPHGDLATPTPTPTPLADRRRPVWTLAAAAAVIGLVIGAVAFRNGGEPEVAGDVEFDQALVDPAGNEIGTVRGVDNGFGRVVTVTTDSLEILPSGEYYEVWFLDPSRPTSSGDVARISAGTFHPDAEGRTDVDLFAAVDPRRYPVMTITAEPDDGDPGPSDTELIRITLDVDAD